MTFNLPCPFPIRLLNSDASSLFHRPPQITVRSTETMKKLTLSSFKHSVNVYWVTSSEADDFIWLSVLRPDAECVLEYKARLARNVEVVPPHLPWATTWGDLMEEWISRWSRGAMFECRGDKKRAAAAFPSGMSTEFNEIWEHVRGALPDLSHRALTAR
jgi:hypothetical protein